ncbi:MAG: hypothetical protein RLZZ270_46, partial [Actinomycetota bacterium]
ARPALPVGDTSMSVVRCASAYASTTCCSETTTGGTRNAGSRWEECMWPWEGELTSLADGILDDETYDWVAVCNAMSDSGGSPVVASEQHVVEAYALAHRTTDIDVSPTGSAGLAGVLAMRDSIADDERVVVVFSGVRRHFMALPNE